MIGPKGKVINALQAETGADIAVDDDGVVGVVTIGAKESSAVEEARRRIAVIIDPPEAEVGAIYPGKVVNITKFGAFVNILPGRDGLLHISKLGGGKRVDRVESVLTLGQEVDVKVDDIDPAGQGVALFLSASGSEGSGSSGGPGRRSCRASRGPRARRRWPKAAAPRGRPVTPAGPSGGVEVVLVRGRLRRGVDQATSATSVPHAVCRPRRRGPVRQRRSEAPTTRRGAERGADRR